MTLYVCLSFCLFPRISVNFVCVGLKLCMGPFVLVQNSPGVGMLLMCTFAIDYLTQNNSMYNCYQRYARF